jgi:hypothetical protein
VGVKVRFGFGLGIIFLTFKTFGNNFNISHRKAPLPISSAARLDVRKDTEVPDPCVSYQLPKVESSYLITTFRPFTMYSPFFVGFPFSLRPSSV